MTRRLTLILTLAVLLLAAALRLHLLGAQSLWNDEGSAYMQATRSLGEIADNAARDIHPPGYYWLLAAWRALTGDTEFALRSLSVFASLLSVALAFALGRALYGAAAGLSAAVFVALNTFSIYYAQEARMYALLALWGAAAMWVFVIWLRGAGAADTRVFIPSPRSLNLRWLVALALLNAAGLWTHYAYPAVMLAQGVLFVLWLLSPEVRVGVGLNPSRSPQIGVGLRMLSAYVAANLLTLALYASWLPVALRQITGWPNTGQPIPTDQALITILNWFATGITYSDASATVTVPFFLLFGLLVFPWHERPDPHNGAAWWRMLKPVLWVVITLGGFLALELFRPANLKFLLPAQIAFAVWLGRGVWVLWTLRTRRADPLARALPKLAALVGVVGLVGAQLEGLPPLYEAPAFQRDDYRGIAALIAAEDDNPGSAPPAVILNAPGQIEAFGYYAPPRAALYPLPIGMTVDAAATEAAVLAILRDHSRVYAVLWGTDERDPQRVVERTLNAQAFPVDSAWYGSVRLARYITGDGAPATVTAGARFSSPGAPDQAIELVDYALSAATARPGDALTLTVRWRSDAPVLTPYKVFVQLLDAEGRLVAQRDSEPANGDAPTPTWQPGALVADRHALIIPHDLPPSQAMLIIGLYNPTNIMERLRVVTEDGAQGDFLTLATIRVTTNGDE